MATVLAACLLMAAYAAQPRIRPFRADDAAISLPYRRDDTIGFSQAAGLSLAIPLASFLWVFYVNSVEKRDGASVYISFLSAALATTAVVENMKNAFGRLRPDFLDRCQPVDGVCTGEAAAVRDGRKSFPSGHTSIAACGLTFLVFFMCREFCLPGLRRRMRTWMLLVLCTLAMLVPVAVGATRVADGKHFVSDVVVGGMIGLVVSMCEFRYLERFVVHERYVSSRE